MLKTRPSAPPGDGLAGPAPTQRGGDARRSRIPFDGHWAVLVLAWIAAGALLVWLRRDIAYSVDEFDWMSRAGIESFRELLAPTNGHLTLVPFLLFRGSLNLFGTSPVPFTFIELFFLAAVSTGIYVFSKQRVGPTLALAPAIAPLFLGAAWPMLLPSMIGILWCCPIAFGLWALIAESRNGPIYGAVTCGLLLLAVASFTVGLSFAAACTVSILLKPDRWRRIWIVAIPIAAYGWWYVWARQFGGEAIDLGNLLLLPAYVVDAIAGAAFALAGRHLPYGPGTSLHLSGFDSDRLMLALLFAAVEVGAIVWAVRWRLKNGPPLRTLWPVVAMAGVWWVSQDLVLGEFRSPVEFRYLFWGAVVVLLLAVELFHGLRPSRRVSAVVLALVLVSMVANLPRFREGHHALAALTQESRADLAALDLAGKRADPSYVLNAEVLTPQSAFIFLMTAPYMETVERFGSPAFSPSELRDQPEPIREAADVTLVRALRLRLAPSSLPAAEGCKTIQPRGAAVSIPLPPGGAILSSPRRRELQLARFGSAPSASLGRLAPGRPALLRIPREVSGVRIAATGPAPLAICTLSPRLDVSGSR
jgi:hypothetical protein